MTYIVLPSCLVRPKLVINILKAWVYKLKDLSDAPIREDGLYCDPNLILVRGFIWGCYWTVEYAGSIVRLVGGKEVYDYLKEILERERDDERRIAALMSAVDAVMDRCEQTARTTSRSLLCWLRSVRPHACYIKPFNFVGKAASRKKYIRLLKRFIAMIFRAYNLSADVRRRRAGI
ncbi:uncharacterized protein FTOL_13658 [Fusarium torulosum]|uniref:Uncharacterized protein n=1 Tax=Fusarium torulosum TaxID=33205 RepID=A0AAE8MMM6_9HYPO|nr:uncharacterized protein FTOL_13658 [Fusarium torulosum]